MLGGGALFLWNRKSQKHFTVAKDHFHCLNLKIVFEKYGVMSACIVRETIWEKVSLKLNDYCTVGVLDDNNSGKSGDNTIS